MKIEILVGMIASGKSTYARTRADEGALVVCHDDLTEMLHGRYRYERELRSIYRAMEEEIAKVAFMAGKDVVIDRTHLTRESRERWINFASDERAFPGNAGLEIVAVAFPIRSAANHANIRWQSDPRGRGFAEWKAVAEHHAAQAEAEPISEGEGFDRVVRLESSATGKVLFP